MEENFVSMADARRVARGRKEMIDKLKKENEDLRKRIEELQNCVKPQESNSNTAPSSWAEREVEQFIERERNAANDAKDDSFAEYGIECAKSALRAYNTLLKDGHSGMSIGITKSILNTLIENKPLTPLTGDDDEWTEVWRSEKEHCTTYQNIRYSGLFKDVNDDGRVEFRDVNRFVCINKNNPNDRFTSPFCAKIAAESKPEIGRITFPYVPQSKPIEIIREELLTDYANGDYDTIHIVSLNYNEPNTGTHVSEVINRYFKESHRDMIEITREEWLERQILAHKLKETFDKVYDEVKAEHPEYKDGEVYRETMRILNPPKPIKEEVEPYCGLEIPVKIG